MLKKLRRRFILAAMAAFGAVMLLLTAGINVLNYYQVAKSQDHTIEGIHEYTQFHVPAPDHALPPISQMPWANSEEPEQAKKLIGYLPEQPPLYMNETPLEYLEFVGEAKGLKGRELKTQMEEVILQTGIDQVKNRLISTLSKGYKQRVGIAQALLGNPKVIILDEPTVGLDPIQIIEIRDLIRKLGETHTVIFSSHILSEVQAICEQVLIISKGKLVAFDTPDNLEKLLTQSNEIHFRIQASVPEAKAERRNQPDRLSGE